MSTHPGINDKVAMELFPPAEQRIIRRFSQHFYVTRGIAPIEIGNAIYRAFLMRPSDDMAVMLNVEREVVALFHPYETWEARTLKAYDYVYDYFDDERIDKSVRILVSQSRRITDSIRDYLAKDPEYPIVIPYTYANFASSTNNFLFAGIRNNHLTRDLFAHDNPLESDYYFFGRDALVSGVIDNHKSRQNSTIFGLRKSGKTSAINAIVRRSKGAGVRTLMLNCENPSIYARRYNDLLAHIISLLRERFNLKPRTISFPADPAIASDQFFIALSDILGVAKSDVMIILDEIEHISPRTGSAQHWRTGEDAVVFWQILRAYFQSDKKYRPTFCFVGTNPSLLEMPRVNNIESPVYLFARSQFMPSLTFEDTQKMLQKLGFFMGLDFDTAVISYIHGRFGGHPFFMRQLCSAIHKMLDKTRPWRVSIVNCQEAEKNMAAKNARYINDILSKLEEFYPAEYEMLTFLANGDLDAFREAAAQGQELIEHLLGYGIIVSRGSDYDVAFELIRDEVRARSSKEAAKDLAGMRAEIGQKRNRLEEELRRQLFYWARRLPAEEWQSSISACTSKNTEIDPSQTPQQVFSIGKSPLYFLDLMRFVIYANLLPDADVKSIERDFQVVNQLRADAHAKAITVEEFSKWKEAMNRLEDRFLPPE